MRWKYKVRESAAPLRLDPSRETLYAYVIKVSGAVHSGARIRLGQYQQVGSAREPPYFRSDRGKAFRNFGLTCLTQDAEAGTRHDTKTSSPLSLTRS